jgi:hypothetical protein
VFIIMSIQEEKWREERRALGAGMVWWKKGFEGDGE